MSRIRFATIRALFESFPEALQNIGADVSLTVFPNTDHTLTQAMRHTGCAELAEAAAED